MMQQGELATEQVAVLRRDVIATLDDPELGRAPVWPLIARRIWIERFEDRVPDSPFLISYMDVGLVVLGDDLTAGILRDLTVVHDICEKLDAPPNSADNSQTQYRAFLEELATASGFSVQHLQRLAAAGDRAR